MANINEFKSRLRGGGARANQFRVLIGFPGYAGGSTRETSFLAQGASLPGQTVTDVPVNYRGRVLHVAGDRTFAPWQITVLNDTDFAIYRSFERWMNAVNNLQDNRGLTDPTGYKTDSRVEHLDRNEAVLKAYNFIGMYPTGLQDIPLDFSTNNVLETFTVDLIFDYFTTSLGGGSNARSGGSGVTGNLNLHIGGDI
jgi:hypothetical protein